MSRYVFPVLICVLTASAAVLLPVFVQAQAPAMLDEDYFDDDRRLIREAIDQGVEMEQWDDVEQPSYGGPDFINGVKSMWAMVTQGSEDGWEELKRKHPLWHNVLYFFHPPVLRSAAANFLTVAAALFTMVVLKAVDTGFWIVYLAIHLFCWGRIISYIVFIILLMKG